MKIVLADLGGDGPRYPFNDGDALLPLGEIENMPGHVAVVDRQGQVWWGYHDEDFREPTEDEL